MRRLVVDRLLWALPVILAVVVVNFLLTRLVPGDPLIAIVGEYPVPQAYADQVRRDLALDQPLGHQLLAYLGQVARGNLGYSFVNREAVSTLVLQRAQASLLLLLPALAVAAVAGALLAWLAASGRSGRADALLTGFTLFGYSIPVFWLGQMLILLFAVLLQWLPAQGMVGTRGVHGAWATVLSFVQHWLMPGLTVALFHMALVARVGRASLQEALGQDYVTTARAKGLPERMVFWRHVLPNGLVPLVTVLGNGFGHALTGTIMVETVFAWPGLGTLFINSILSRDYPVVQAIFLLSAVAVVLVNLLTDIVYGLVDPRIRDGRHARG